MTDRMRTFIFWTISVLLALWMMFRGFLHLWHPEEMLRTYDHWSYSVWLMNIIGIAEIIFGFSVLLPSVRRWAVLGLTIILIGAAATHAMSDEMLSIPAPLIAMGMGWLILFLAKKEGPIED